MAFWFGKKKQAKADATIAKEYRDWLDRFPKEPPERMALARAAVDCFDACGPKKDLAQVDIQPLVEAASSPYKVVCETGAALLVFLARTRSEAQDALRAMATATTLAARFNAVGFLTHTLPEALRIEIIDMALKDKSAKVREKGIERAEGFGITSFLPQFEKMQASETNDAVRRSLEFHIPLLRDGYLLQPSSDGAGYFLIVRTSSALGGPYIPKELCTKEYIEKVVAEQYARSH